MVLSCNMLKRVCSEDVVSGSDFTLAGEANSDGVKSFGEPTEKKSDHRTQCKFKK